jgi:hypothetical protein
VEEWDGRILVVATGARPREFRGGIKSSAIEVLEAYMLISF